MSQTSPPSGQNTAPKTSPKAHRVYSGPDFAGDNSPITLDEWEFKLKCAFMANDITSDMQQVYIAQGATSNSAATFLRVEMNKASDNMPYKTFKQLIDALTKRFKTGNEELDATLKLMEIQMQSNESVADYCARFLDVAEKSELDDKTQCRVFVKGLRKDLGYLRRELLPTMRKDNVTELLNQAQLLANQTKPFKPNHNSDDSGPNPKKHKFDKFKGGRGGRGPGGRFGGRFGGGRHGLNGRGGRANGRGRGRGGRGNGQQGGFRPLNEVLCFKCGQYGHYADKCDGGNGQNNKRKLAALEHELAALRTEKQYNEMYMAAMNVPTLAQASGNVGLVPQAMPQPHTAFRPPAPPAGHAAHNRT